MRKGLVLLVMVTTAWMAGNALAETAAAPQGPAKVAAVAPATAPVNVNLATLQELQGLPGIGPVTAERIIQYRQEKGPFKSVDQLVKVKGIGQATLAKIRDRVSVQ